VSDLRVPLDSALEAFGVPATVTRPAPDDTPIVTTGFWVSPLEETRPYGTDFQRRDPRRVFVLSRTTVPTLPRGTKVLAPEVLDGLVMTWRVDGLDGAVAQDHWRAVLIQTA
jgi:hypothetical protein